MSRWCLEGNFNTNTSVELCDINSFPLVLGRSDSADRPIPDPSVSRRHACIILNNHESLLIEDLGSSNGNFVNRNRIETPTRIHHGDTLHIGDAEIRLIDRTQIGSASAQQAALDPGATMMMPAATLAQNSAIGVLEMEELIEKRLLKMVFQPIVTPKGAKTIGYEVLARSAHPKLSQNPMVLFGLAEKTDQAVALSELAREIGVQTARTHGLKGALLLNTHPKEMEDLDALVASLQKLRADHSNTPLTLEIHENAVTGLDQLRTLKQELLPLSIQLAFDDFGVGQSRLMEIIEAKPDLIKFDRALIDGIDQADAARISMLKNLKIMVQDLGITSLAECVSNEGEYLACEQIGFDLYQGFYFGRPAGAETFK